MKRIRFVSEAVALTIAPSHGAAMVSITEPGRDAPLAGDGWGALLRVRFADAEYDGAMIESLRARGKAFSADAKGFPSATTSRRVVAFLEALRGRDDIAELIVHCHAGQRRSAAVAKFASEMFPAAICPDCTGFNKTVYMLLKNPDEFGRGSASSAQGPLGRWFASLFAK